MKRFLPKVAWGITYLLTPVNLLIKGKNYPQSVLQRKTWYSWPERELPTDPGELSLGVAPRVALGIFCSVFSTQVATQIGQQPRDAMRLHRRQVVWQALRGQIVDQLSLASKK